MKYKKSIMKATEHWLWDIVSIVAGIGLTLAFSPFDFWLLGIFSIAIAMYSWRGITGARAFLRGFLFGLGLFGTGISWVYVSVHYYGGAPVAGAVLLTMFSAAFWALFPALTAYLNVKFTQVAKTEIGVFQLPLIWILLEYFRGDWLLNGFPWLQVGYTQTDSWLGGYAPLIGSYGVGFLVLISAAVIANTLQKHKLNTKSVVSILAVWLFGWLSGMYAWTEPAGKNFTVSLIQGNVAQDQKWLPENRVNTLINYQALTEQHWGSDVIIWPETAIPAYYHEVNTFFLLPLERRAQATDTSVIVSMPAKGKNENELYNMIVTLGDNRSEYKKTHLLPFGEYLPLQPLSGFILNLLQVNLGNFKAGDKNQPLMVAAGYPFAASICYEDAFASVFLSKLPEAAYLVNVTNDAWFGDSLEPHQHMQIARMRSMEMGRYMLRATNTGVSGIINEKGVIVKSAPMFERKVISGDVTPMTGLTPYYYLGDLKVILLIVFLSLMLLFFQKGSVRHD